MSNIQVAVRCRGRTSKEIAAKSPVVIGVSDEVHSSEEPYVIVYPHTDDKVADLQKSKTYKVDQVYGPQADQSLLFEGVALPLFEDFMKGYNVTILAYGQTGTGKTYTMCGDYLNEISPETGIIPRVLKQLFETLENDVDNDYLVKCSFVELYNEELKDLLNDEAKAPLRVYDNKQKKNGSSTILIQNLKEEVVVNTHLAFDTLRRGVLKRKTASTKLNDFSSRSHTIFSISLFRKSYDDFFRVSKMNLVDLAGSENITRSGAINQRAKEAGSINQSLLTLGRVINSLSDKSVNANHIPYRESKLTRLLQDSVGGETKTTLIATISPAKVNADETASTLDYASKAKDIRNIPQLGHTNDLIMKRIMVKELSKEISKLNQDLVATRKKNGIYLNEVNYKNLIAENESMRSELKELSNNFKRASNKADQLEKAKANLEESQKATKQSLTLAENKNKTLEKKHLEINNQLIESKSKAEELGKKFNKLTEKHKIATNHLTQTVNQSLESCVVKIDKLLESQDNQTAHEKLTKFNGEVGNHLRGLKRHLTEGIVHMERSIESSIGDLPQTLHTLSEGYAELCETFSKKNESLQLNIEELKIANAKFSGYIKEDYLTQQMQTKVTREFLDNKVKDEVKKVQENLQTHFERLLNQVKDSYGGLLQGSINDFSTRLLTNEKRNIEQRHENWNMTSEKVHHNMDQEFITIKKVIQSSRETHSQKISTAFDGVSHKLAEKLLKNVNSFKNTVNGEDLNLAEEKLQDIDTLRKYLDNKSGQIKETLSSVNKDLHSIHHSNTDSINFYQSSSPAKSSPTRRSPSGSSPIRKSPQRQQKVMVNKDIISPLKVTSSNALNSKIPQLGKPSHDFEDSIDSATKRRKTFVDNLT